MDKTFEYITEHYREPWFAGTDQKTFKKIVQREELEKIDLSVICDGIQEDTITMNDERHPPRLSMKLAANIMYGATKIFNEQVDNLLAAVELVLSAHITYEALLKKDLLNVKSGRKDKKQKNNSMEINEETFDLREHEKFEAKLLKRQEDKLWDSSHVANPETITRREYNNTGFSFAASTAIDDIGLNEFDDVTEIEWHPVYCDEEDAQPNTDALIDDVVLDTDCHQQPVVEEMTFEVDNHHGTNEFSTVMQSYRSEVPENEPQSLAGPNLVASLLQTDSEIQFQPNVFNSPERFELKPIEPQVGPNMKRAVNRGQKRKFDSLLEISSEAFKDQMKNYSDTCLDPMEALVNIPKMNMPSSEYLLQNPGRFFKNDMNEGLREQYYKRVKYLSDILKKPSLKRKNCAKNQEGNAPKKLRRSTRLDNKKRNNSTLNDSAPVQLPPLVESEPDPFYIEEDSSNQEPPQVINDDLLDSNILNRDQIQSPFYTESTETEEVKHYRGWRLARAKFGIKVITKKLTSHFKNDQNGISFGEFLQLHECNRKDIVVTFTSLILLRGRKEVELSKFDNLYIDRIRKGEKFDL